jgi:hypothetical protein
LIVIASSVRGDGSRERARPARHNLRASYLQVKPRKNKEKGLDFLGFPWPNRGFSMGYREKNKKNLAALNSRVGL